MLSGLIALGARALATPIGEPCGDRCPDADDACATCADATTTDGEEPTRGTADVGAVVAHEAVASVAGALDARDVDDAAARRASRWRWGRLDLAVAWRRTVASTELLIARGTTPTPRTGDELWLVATWRP